MEVLDLCLLPEQRLIYVALQSFDWDFSFGIEVRLCQETQCLHAKQVGRGTVGHHPQVALAPSCEWLEAEETIRRFRTKAQTPIFIEQRTQQMTNQSAK